MQIQEPPVRARKQSQAPDLEDQAKTRQTSLSRRSLLLDKAAGGNGGRADKNKKPAEN